MSIVKTGVSAIGKLLIVAALAVSFLIGMFGVVYLSLRGTEIQVPEIVGKNREDAEKELAALGLKMKKRADRYSEEKPNTILEQSPKAGTTAKTGQQILVVVSQVNAEGSEAPATVEKEPVDENTAPDGTDDKPKPAGKNANVKKPVASSRDVESTKPKPSPSTKPGLANTGKTNTASANTGGTSSPANTKVTTPTASSPKPTPAKSPSGGDTRERKIPQ